MNFKAKSDFDASLLLFSQKFKFFSFDCVALIFSLVLSLASRQKKEQDNLKSSNASSLACKSENSHIFFFFLFLRIHKINHFFVQIFNG
jgi:hypothetical protein